MSSDSRIRIFVREIWKWYARHKRTLPWRDLTVKDPDHRAYLILVSEIMLQQTQVSRVIEKYKEFIQKFPRTEDLAKASNAEVLVAWRGMGYNSRALRLRDAAKALTPVPSPVGRGGQAFPQSMSELMALPGIGHYTAAAIRNFAFSIPTPCLDTNIRRILHRFFVGPERADGTWRAGDAYLLALAGKILDVALEEDGRGLRGLRRQRGLCLSAIPSSLSSLSSFSSSSSSWHAALMDFGSLVMTKTHPKWDQLSPALRSICKAYGKRLSRTKKLNRIEPGIDVDGRFIPRRIVRGKVIEALRNAHGWMTIDEALRKIALGAVNDEEWIGQLMQGLERDGLIERRGMSVRLKQ